MLHFPDRKVNFLCGLIRAVDLMPKSPNRLGLKISRCLQARDPETGAELG